MTGFLTYAVSFLVAIGLLVAVHEFGHFIVARLLGIKVLRFSVGFGRVLWSRQGRVDGTEYCLSAIPLGGYVKLLDERDCAVTFAERSRAFNRQSAPARIAVLAAGPLINLVFAVLMYWIIFVSGVPGLKPLIGAVSADSIAARAGLRDGDVIRRVGERDVATWEGATLAILEEMLGDSGIPLTVVDRDGRQRSVTIATAGREAELTEPGQLFEKLGLRPWRPGAVIAEVPAGSAAARAGLAAGDQIVSIDAERVASPDEVVAAVRERPGRKIAVGVVRDGESLTLSVTLENVVDGNRRIGRMGVPIRAAQVLPDSLRAVERYGVVESLGKAVGRTWDMSVLTLRMMWRMVFGDVSVRNISGPISIAQYAGESASLGLTYFLRFLALVSLSLGILNLLPVPVLDGGQIVYTLAEAMKGGPLSERSQLIGQQIGLALLLTLMTFAFYNDLSRLFG